MYCSSVEKEGDNTPLKRLLDSGESQSKKSAKKSKKDVDTRASKGRKIRYLKLPKAVDFMFPEIVNYFTDVQRANILEQMKTTCR
ncbi:unnamed protein product [Hymenolepis diminuta]|nr:unnamed protein product [Hymenolepis diminuta]